MTTHVNQNLSSTDQLVVVIDLPNQTPDFAFRAWTDTTWLTRWWPPQAEIEPRLGGHYRLHWPHLGQTLRGEYTIFDPGHELAFTWQWDHEIGTRQRFTVQIIFEPTAAGTRLTLTHSDYAESAEDQMIRIEHHWAGWQHFLPHLAELQEKYSSDK